jgi:hypothetical protein
MNLASKLGVAALAAALTAGLTVPAASAGNAHADRRAAYKPTLKASTPAVEAKKAVVLSGKVKPATKGTKVVLEKRIGEAKKWSTEATLKTTKKGTFTYTDKPKNVGVRYYRVVVPKAGKVKAGKSKPVKVTVSSWQSLANIPFRHAESTVVSWSGTKIANTPYAPSIVSAPYAHQGKADWNIPSTCTALRVRLGNGDQSDQSERVTITLDGGPGQFLYTKSFGLTESEVQTFDVSDVFRLNFTWQTTISGSAEPEMLAQAVLAQPELYCS